MKKIIIGLAFFLIASQSYAVINGDEVTEESRIWESVVKLSIFGHKQMSTCSGSIVSENLILTAAHCFERADSPQRVLIHFQQGSQKSVFGRRSQKEVARLKATDYLIHPSRQKNDTISDLALIRFEGGLPQGFRPAQLLPTEELVFMDDSYSVIAGFGQSNLANPEENNPLRSARLKLEKNGYSLYLQNTNGKTACYGDSGGPAYLEIDGTLFLIGVASSSFLNCHTGTSYTNLLLKWNLPWFKSKLSRYTSTLTQSHEISSFMKMEEAMEACGTGRKLCEEYTKENSIFQRDAIEFCTKFFAGSGIFMCVEKIANKTYPLGSFNECANLEDSAKLECLEYESFQIIRLH